MDIFAKRTAVLLSLALITQGFAVPAGAASSETKTFTHTDAGKVYASADMGFATTADESPESCYDVNNDSNSSNDTVPFSMVYVPMFWNEFQKEKPTVVTKTVNGQQVEEVTDYGIDFATWVNRYNLKKWHDRNVKFILRLSLDEPIECDTREANDGRDVKLSDGYYTMPKWYYDELVAEGADIHERDYDFGLSSHEDNGETYYTWSSGYSPDYTDPDLMKYHRIVLEGVRDFFLNGNEWGLSFADVAYIEMGSVGHWGENHTYYFNNRFNGTQYEGMPTGAAYEAYMQHYDDIFGDIRSLKLMSRNNMQFAQDHGWGVFNDVFGEYDSLTGAGWTWLDELNNGRNLYGLQAGPYTDFWDKAPVGGELSSNMWRVPGEPWADQWCWFKNENFKDGINEVKGLLTQLYMCHTTFLGQCAPAGERYSIFSDEMKANVDTFLKHMGYRFLVSSLTAPKEASRGETVTMDMTVQNLGVARFYYNWGVRFALYDEQTGWRSDYTSNNLNTDKWLPGSGFGTGSYEPGVTECSPQLQIPADTEPGEYKIVIGIGDPDSKKLTVGFANEQRTDEGYYVIGSIKVTGDPVTPTITPTPIPAEAFTPAEAVKNGSGDYYTLEAFADGSLKVSYNKETAENWHYLELDLSGVDRNRYQVLKMTVKPGRDGLVMGVTDDGADPVFLRDHWSGEATFSGTGEQEVVLDLSLVPNAESLYIWCDPLDDGASMGAQSFVIKSFELSDGTEPTVTPSPVNGWQKSGGKWYYYKNGNVFTGWQKSGGKWYYLDPSRDGAMAKGWKKVDGKWYYLGTDGAMQTGLVNDGSKTYICKSSGELVINGWASVGGDWYHTDAGGAVKKNAWQKSAGKWYYFGADGRMVSSCTITVDGVSYSFDANGAWIG